MMDALKEILPFLQPCARSDLKSVACINILKLTGTDEGLRLLKTSSEVIVSLIHLIHDKESYTARDAIRILVNISADEVGAATLLALKEEDIVSEMIKCIEQSEYQHADFACAVLANMTRPKMLCQKVFHRLSAIRKGLEDLVYILCQLNYNTAGAKLHLLASVLTNFSQLPEGRRDILDKERCVFQRLLAFTEYKESKGRRQSVIATIHNCAFDKDYHPWLLSDNIDILPRLLLPLAGPDVYTEEESDSLPLDLQFLPEDKEREPDPEIRKLLLETIMQLCMTRKCRDVIRKQNAYLILREHHKWETDRKCIMLNEDIVNLMIRTEDEIGADDLSSLDVPDDLVAKFNKMDSEYLAEGLEDRNSIDDDTVGGASNS